MVNQRGNKINRPLIRGQRNTFSVDLSKNIVADTLWALSDYNVNILIPFEN